MPRVQPHTDGDAKGLITAKLTEDTRSVLRCPKCKSTLNWELRFVRCSGPCKSAFPLVDEVPILINESRSIFTIEDCLERRQTTSLAESPIRRVAKRILPPLGSNPKSRDNYRALGKLLAAIGRPNRVLVIGGRTLGTGMDILLGNPQVQLIESDVALGGRTALICDAHDLPFADHSLDAVIAQAVLEHVADPWRCANEIHRVLKPSGLVYAETPFMQQVHGGRYDFTRFTALGHRRLFRQFDQIDAGSGGGPGTVLAWSYFYFLRSFARSKRGVDIAAAVARLTGFWLRYVDFFLVDRPAAQDGAWGYFFLGRRSDNVLSDRDLIAIYKDL